MYAKIDAIVIMHSDEELELDIQQHYTSLAKSAALFWAGMNNVPASDADIDQFTDIHVIENFGYAHTFGWAVKESGEGSG